MIIASLVVPRRPPLNTFLGNIQCDPHFSVRRGLCGQNAELDGAQGTPGISVRNIRKEVCRVFIDGSIIHAHALFAVVDSAHDQGPHICPGKRLQLEDRRPGDERPVHLKIGVFRGRPDQCDRTVLNERKQIVLLGFIEAVDLIDKEDRLFSVHAQTVFGAPHGFLHVLFAGGRGIELDKLRTRGIGDHPRQCGLAGAGRSVKNQ